MAWCISVYCGDTSDTSNIAYFLNIVIVTRLSTFIWKRLRLSFSKVVLNWSKVTVKSQDIYNVIKDFYFKLMLFFWAFSQSPEKDERQFPQIY